MNLEARAQVVQAKLKELIATYQQTQAQLNLTQQEIYKFQGQLELLQQMIEEAKVVHDGDLSRRGGDVSAPEYRPTQPPRSARELG